MQPHHLAIAGAFFKQREAVLVGIDDIIRTSANGRKYTVEKTTVRASDLHDRNLRAVLRRRITPDRIYQNRGGVLSGQIGSCGDAGVVIVPICACAGSTPLGKHKVSLNGEIAIYTILPEPGVKSAASGLARKLPRNQPFADCVSCKSRTAMRS